jgi:acyl-CoA reductase-like NAD-dependent aldehyde dehydrogenase
VGARLRAGARTGPRTGGARPRGSARAGLNVITGAGATVGQALAADPRIDGVSFTGSVRVGTSVRDVVTSRGGRVQLELGGQNPLLVVADARLDAAVEAAYAGAFWSAGQKCTATRRILVEDSVYDEFRERLLARVAAGRVGDPADPKVEVGPLVSERALEDVLAGIKRGHGEGGRTPAGGERLDRDGWFVAPTVFEDVGDDAYLSCEEVFGPVTSLYRFSDLDEAIERANAVRFGLSASIFTQSLATSERFVRSVRAGILHVNSQTAGAEPHVPFGGVKGSAHGPHEQGRAALEFYTETVTVYRDV